jgi:predicted protein tyrosine phosphatase
MQLTVCNIGQVPSMILFKGATHVITMLRNRERNELHLPKSFNKDNWLFLDMDDVINEDAELAPQKEQVKQLLNWVKLLPKDAHLVIHCYAGVSRSTAAALAVKVQELGVDRVKDAIDWLLENRPVACPNPVITKFADELLNAKGELHAAAEEVANNKLLSLYGGNLTSRNHIRE